MFSTSKPFFEINSPLPAPNIPLTLIGGLPTTQDEKHCANLAIVKSHGIENSLIFAHHIEKATLMPLWTFFDP